MKKYGKLKQILATAFCLILIASCATVPVMAAEPQQGAVKTVKITLSLEQDNYYMVIPEEVTVSASLSDEYGYVDQVTDGVSVLDGLIAVHQILLGDAFVPETKDDVLAVTETGFITKVLGEDTQNFGFAVNGMTPNDGVLNPAYGTYTGYSANQAEIKNDDVLQFFYYNPAGYWGEIYTNFLQGDRHVTQLLTSAGAEEKLSVKGYSYAYEGCNPEIKWKNVKNAQICLLSVEGETAGMLEPIEGAVTDKDGNVTLTFDKAGTYCLAITSDPENYTYILPQLCNVTVVDSAEDVKAVKAAEGKIDAIGKTAEQSQAAIKEARTAYDALTESQKALVSNLDVLLAAEKNAHVHEFQWVITKAPTENAAGEMQGTCICGEVMTAELPKLNIVTESEKDDAFHTALNADTLFDKVTLTEAEKEALAAGQDLKLTLHTADITDSVSDSDKKLVASVLNKNKLGLYLDITLDKQVGTNEAAAVANTLSKVSVTIEIPESLRSADKNVARTYQVIRIHDGEAEVLDSRFHAESNTLTFETDRFSTYAVVYSDQTNPATGDGFPVLLSSAVMVSALLSIAYISSKKYSR